MGYGTTSIVEADRVLLKDQTTQSENGIYNASSGDWTRAPDFDGARDVVRGSLIVFAASASSSVLYQVLTAPDEFDVDDVVITLIDSPARVIPLSQKEIDNSVTPTDFGFEWGDVRRYGADETGAIDAHTAFANAILSEHVVKGEGDFKWASGLAIPEGGRLELAGGGRDASKATITVTGSGAQKGIYSDGTFVTPGFSGRRDCALDGFLITDNQVATPAALIDLHFTTQYEIADVAVIGQTSVIGMSLTNCAEGTIRRIRIQSQAVGAPANAGAAMNYGLYFTNDPADSFFSGQTLLEDIYVKFVKNAGNTGVGIYINRQINTLAHMDFQKVHVHACNIGLRCTGTVSLTLDTWHFEANTINDYLGDVGTINPTFINAFCNNSATVAACFDLKGNGGAWIGGRIINVDNGADMLRVTGNGFFIGGGAQFRLGSGPADAQAIRIKSGATGTVIDGISLEGSTAWPDAILIDAGALNTEIGVVTVDGITGPVVTNNGTGTRYRGAINCRSSDFDLAAAATADYFDHKQQAVFVNRAHLFVKVGNGTGSTTISIGIPGDPTRFLSAYNVTNSQPAGTRIDLASLLQAGVAALAATDVLVISKSAVAGGDTGVVVVEVELTPFRAQR